MPTPPVTFELHQRDADPASHARLGTIHTPHGPASTPGFMPVGTQAALKGLTVDQVRGIGADVVLANTYHLMLRPGGELIASLGGLHGFMKWAGPILTDSGGFQVFSLADGNRITDEGVTFKSHLDGSMHELTPERSMLVQNQLGADIIMAFDDCPPAHRPSAHAEQRADALHKAVGIEPVAVDDYDARVRVANERTVRWLERCVASHARPTEQALFGIVQGGTDLDQRDWCVDAVCGLDLPGYAIGGVAVGESPEEIERVVRHTAPKLPADRPRYLMGVGYERDLVRAVRAGVDVFDCVMPTRNGRNGSALTPTGTLRMKNAVHKADPAVIDPACDCPACGGGYSRAYLRHLFMADEMLGPILVSLHNLRHLQRLMLDIRHAIRDNAWLDLAQRWPVTQLDPASLPPSPPPANPSGPARNPTS